MIGAALGGWYIAKAWDGHLINSSKQESGTYQALNAKLEADNTELTNQKAELDRQLAIQAQPPPDVQELSRRAALTHKLELEIRTSVNPPMTHDDPRVAAYINRQLLMRGEKWNVYAMADDQPCPSDTFVCADRNAPNPNNAPPSLAAAVADCKGSAICLHPHGIQNDQVHCSISHNNFHITTESGPDSIGTFIGNGVCDNTIDINGTVRPSNGSAKATAN